jgi:cysteine desulfurase
VIYWDHNATSPIRRRVLERMNEAFELYGANPNSSHSLGQTARAAIEKARRTIADRFGCQPNELVFAASATEANMMASWGLWFERTRDHPNRKKILMSPLEHSSVHENVLFLVEKFGAEIVWIPLKNTGELDLQAVETMLKKDDFVFCASIGAQNETGAIEPWEDLAQLCETAGVPIHSDLVQCVARTSFHLRKSHVATATLSFHKAGGPKGVSCLFIRDRVKVDSVIRGGSQEKKRRAGTENIAAIVGAEALVEECSDLQKVFETNVRGVRDYFEFEIKSRLPNVSIVCADMPRLPNTSYIVFGKPKSDALLMSLDFKGICLSSGSACSSGIIVPSRALMNLGYSESDAMTAIRFSLGPDNTREEADQVIAAVESSVLKLAA